jgi:hypothetical protein
MQLHEFKPKDTRNYRKVINQFCLDIDGFRREPEDTQLHLVNMVRLSRAKYRQHKTYPEGAWFHHRELDLTFGRGQFKLINYRLRLFKIMACGNGVQGLCDAYIPLDKTIDTYLKGNGRKPRGQLQKTYDGAGRIINKLKRALHSRNTSGDSRSFWKQYEKLIPQLVPVDIEKLNWLENEIKARLEGDLFVPDVDRDKAWRWLDKIAIIRNGATREVTGRGIVEHNYKEASTGRLSATHDDNLQNCPRLIRHTALHGMWDYDFSNCHYSILTQMVHIRGMDTTALFNIRHYLENKKEVRQTLVDDIGVSESRVKGALNAILYGGHATAHPKTKMYKAFDRDVEKINAIANHPLYSGLEKDVKEATRFVLEVFPHKGNRYTNMLGKKVGADNPPGEIMANLLQGAEAKMLSIALELYHDSIVLLVHDGFVCKTRLTRHQQQALIDAIKHTTDYVMTLDEKELRAEAPDADMGLSR